MSASAEAAAIDEIVIAGQRLRVAETDGHGERPLVICNDFLANLDILDEFCSALGRATLRFDLPGIGGASGPARMQRMAGLARLVAELVAARGHDRFDLLGVGWGGLLAQRIARDYGGRIHRLVLVATSAGQLMFPGRIANLRRLASLTGLQRAAIDAQDVRSVFGGRRREECEMVAQAMARAMAPSRRGYLAQCYALAGFSSLPWLHRLTMPTLVLSGDDDPIVPLVNARVLTLLVPRSELSVMRGAGHWLLLERADEAARRVAAFLDLAQPLHSHGNDV